MTFAEMCALADEVAARAHRRRDPAGRAHRRGGVPQVPDQPVAPLRQAGPLPGRHPPVRRRRRQLQPDLRPGHDDDARCRPGTCGGRWRRRAPTWPANSTRATAKIDVPGVDDERDRRPGTAPGHRADALVVPPGGRAVRPVPRRGRDGSCSRRMVSAPVQPAGQPLHGPVDAAGRPHHPAQHAAVAGRATGGQARRASAPDRDLVPGR